MTPLNQQAVDEKPYGSSSTAPSSPRRNSTAHDHVRIPLASIIEKPLSEEERNAIELYRVELAKAVAADSLNRVHVTVKT